MICEELGKLVDQANQCIVDSGCFPTNWTEHYRAALATVEVAYDGPFWPKRLFAELHYVSTHLCLRYKRWRTSESTGNHETEESLREIQRDTEIFMWHALAKLPIWTELIEGEEQRLVSLCFGKLGPAEAVSTTLSFQDWKKSYLECVGRVQDTLLRRNEWSKWICVALHFAAFYVDLYQQQEIDLSEAVDEQKPSAILEALARHIGNHRVLALIRLWLNTTGAERDSSGVPRLAQYRPRTGQFISVRTATELLIQSNGEAPDD